MDKRTMVAVAAILTTLAETAGEAPASLLYIGLGMDHSFYVKVQVILASAGLVTVADSHMVTLTARGREVAAALAREISPGIRA